MVPSRALYANLGISSKKNCRHLWFMLSVVFISTILIHQRTPFLFAGRPLAPLLFFVCPAPQFYNRDFFAGDTQTFKVTRTRERESKPVADSSMTQYVQRPSECLNMVSRMNGLNMKQGHNATPAWYFQRKCSPTRISRPFVSTSPSGKSCGEGLPFN